MRTTAGVTVMRIVMRTAAGGNVIRTVVSCRWN